jgi:hypothetical protein
VQYPGHRTCMPAERSTDKPEVRVLSRISACWSPAGLWHVTMAWLGAAPTRFRSAAASMAGSFPPACLQALLAGGRT